MDISYPQYVYFWPDGMITSLDETVFEMAQFSGRRTRKLLAKICKAARPSTTFHKGPQWHPIIPREEVCGVLA